MVLPGSGAAAGVVSGVLFELAVVAVDVAVVDVGIFICSLRRFSRLLSRTSCCGGASVVAVAVAVFGGEALEVATAEAVAPATGTTGVAVRL